MKKSILLALSAAFLVLLATSLTGHGQTVIFSYDEYGENSINGQSGTPGTLGVDSHSGITTLRFALPVQGTVPGDIVVVDSATGLTSDILRFGGDGFLYFFSDKDDPGPFTLADSTLPTTLLPNHLTFFEGPSGTKNGLFNYSPGSGQPGQNGGFNSQYNFISDAPAPVPEPNTAYLLVAGFATILLMKFGAARCLRHKARI
jgi:hypothetical protein